MNQKPAAFNRLSQESSLYLRQHAGNPVDWHPWGEEALAKARLHNKPLLISIGYSACHWCHVMEHESFSDDQVADFMNRHFINIKIDREERPDLDQLYMEAVQLLHGHGGWPLNCFALPDGQPFWGATYFTREQWLDVLDQIATLYRSEPQTLIEQAERISHGIAKMNISVTVSKKDDLQQYDPTGLFKKLSSSFDNELGGFRGAPKFPMPSVYRFLLHYHHIFGEPKALDHVIQTLKSMAAGGIYDQVGGGFARYSTDVYWKVPHFEKMLYDNAQLITLYCEAFLVSRQQPLLDIALETINFLEREMGNAKTGFSAAIDADSPEGEGSFYTFSTDEINHLLSEDAALLTKYWKAGEEGLWEKGKSILLAHPDKEAFANENHLELDRFNEKLEKARSVLLEYRNKRLKPVTDTKVITSWNALMAQAYLGLYQATENKRFLENAEKLANFILNKLTQANGDLLHIPVKKNLVPGFLDDYSAFMLTLIKLHSATLDEKWALKANELAGKAISQFYDEQKGLFFYSGANHEKTFAQRQEIHDNVIPSSNSMMIESLFALGHIFENDDYLQIAERAVSGMAENILKHPSSFSNWARLFLMHVQPFQTLVIAGRDAKSFLDQFNNKYLPQVLVSGGYAASQLPVINGRFVQNKTLLYVCSGRTCYPPVETVDEAMKYL